MTKQFLLVKKFKDNMNIFQLDDSDKLKQLVTPHIYNQKKFYVKFK